jgi:hypothetical protein
MGLNETSWKETALLMVPELMAPELTRTIDQAGTPYLLWFELWSLFKAAYNEPRNGSLIKRIYKYADWCEMQPRGATAVDDLLTCASVCFYEELPTCEPAREDMPNWFTEKDFRDMRDVFRYHFTDEEFEKIEADFAGRTFRGRDWDDLE